MTVATTEFVDCTGGNFNNAPLVPGSVRLVYVTGEGSVPETTAELQAAQAAGVGVIPTDQQPGLLLFRAGKAGLADIERGAATVADFVAAVASRQALGITEHTGYNSYDNLGGLESAVNAGNPAGVGYHVADYARSLSQSQNLLAANPTWRAVQFGDPASNPLTLVPGTQVTLQMAQFDIDCGLTSWLATFLPGAPAPAPAPVPAPTAALPWPFGPFDYMGTPHKDPYCHSGYFSSVDAHVVALWQQRMQDRGWYYQGARLTADGRYGLNEAAENEGSCPTVCAEFQAEFGLGVDHLVGGHTWNAA